MPATSRRRRRCSTGQPGDALGSHDSAPEQEPDIGALTDEMAIREHLRVDVLVRVAAHRQSVDVEPTDIERFPHLDEAAARPFPLGTLELGMRVISRPVRAGFISAVLAVSLLPAPTANADSPPNGATADQPTPAAVVPDSAPATPTPPPASPTPRLTIDPQAPLVLSDPHEPHAVEDPEQTATVPKTPREPKADKRKANAKPARTTRTEPGAPAPRAPGLGNAALVAMPAEAPAGVPSYFIDSFRIPVFLLPIYQAAGIQYGVRWEILAAINEIETDYGRNLNVSSAGAQGWMQFIASTWLGFGVDANGDGRADPYNPADAIFAAARYLQASGAAVDLRKALFAYNHADWYVESVLRRAQRLTALPADLVSALTGLAQGRSPVLGAARELAAAPAAAGRPRRSLDLRVRDRAPAVAVADGEVVRIGRSARLGRFVQLRDVYGTTYTYGGLGSVARRYPVLRRSAPASVAPRAPGRKLAGRDLAAAVTTLSALAHAGTRAAGAPPVGAPRSTAGTQVAPGGPIPARGTRLVTRGGRPAPVAARGTPLVAPRGRSVPAPAAAPGGPLSATDWAAQAQRRLAAATPVAKLVRPRPRPRPRIASAYDLRLLGGVDAERVRYEPLREGSRLVAGTIIGHATGSPARPARLRFEIRPAGERTPRIDPRPIVAGWKLLRASAPTLPPVGTAAPQTSVGQILLLGKRALQRLVLGNPRIALYPCGREDVAAGRVDRRVLATLQLLAMSGLSPTVSSLQCGHSRLTASGNVSEHWSGNAVDISAVNGVAILGNQGAGTIAETTIRRLLTLQGTMRPHQIISLMTFAGAANTLALPDHADHIHVGFAPLDAPASLHTRLLDGMLEPKAWQRLIDRLAAIDNPRLPPAPSSAATSPVAPTP